MIVIQTILISLLLSCCIAEQYKIDDNGGMGRMFDGIGGLSGGGATSKLLPNYPEPQKTQILDYLFKPNFGASLQILKVEIGGDSQSTDGTEASHMHNEWEENYSRGYEWWLMTEAKKRNPRIQISALPWGFPRWVSKGNNNPYTYPSTTAMYIVKWILGAKQHHNLTVDYIGIWNEREYNIDYIITLRAYLDLNGLGHTKIVAPDGVGWEMAKDVMQNSTLKDSLYAIGDHYPGTTTTKEALDIGLRLWASEDYSTFNDNIGAGCWARILNQNYVNGYITSTVAWSAISAYYNNLPFPRCGLMTSPEPWSGHYVVNSPIWITAHTTQFTQIGWKYFKHGSGTGKLSKGGSYVSLLSPGKEEFTMVIETMSHDHSKCIRPSLPLYKVSSQNATFQLKGTLAKVKALHVWFSKLGFNGKPTVLMQKGTGIKPSEGYFSVHLESDMVLTITTMSSGGRGLHPAPPKSRKIELPFYDNFDKYTKNSEENFFVPQGGSFEVVKSTNGSRRFVNRQTVMQQPITWVRNLNERPIIIGGNYNWMNASISIDVLIPTTNGTDGVFLAVRVDQSGSKVESTNGIFLWIFPINQTYVVTCDLAQKQVLKRGKVVIRQESWFTMAFTANKSQISLGFGENEVIPIPKGCCKSNGFVAYGTHNFGLVDFDNFKVEAV